eukprot:PITA_33037
MDLDRIKEISEISLPHNKKAMQSFLGQINFVKIFVPDFSRIVSPLQMMIKKNSIFKWVQDQYEAFNLIKQAIINAPSLPTPNFSEPFVLYTFAYDRSYAAILTQENQEKAESPIAFFSSNLQAAKLNYSDVEKQAYTVFKEIKYFRPFLLKTRTKIIVPFPAVRNLLVQKDVGEKRANWVTSLQEYDVEIKLASIVKGQGFCKMMAEASLISEIPSIDIQVYEVSLNDNESLYADIIYYLKNGYAPSHLNHTKKRALRNSMMGQQVDTMLEMLLHIKSYVQAITSPHYSKTRIITFGLHSALMFDNASYFSGNSMTEFALKRGFKLKYSANYYPQGNGLAESTNKNLINIIKRTVDQNHKNWHKSLIHALWADRITKKASIGTSPFNLVYGKEVVLPTHLAIPSLSLVQDVDEVPTSSLQLRKMEIIKLEEQ